MLEECLEVFQKELERKTEMGMDKEKWLLDNYIPKAGIYVLINIENDFVIDEVLPINKDTLNENLGSVHYISALDYYSKLIMMNKPIAKKQVHSNNMYAFFVRKGNLGNKLEEECIDKYYFNLRNPYEKYKNPKAKKMYEEIEKEIGPVNVAEVEEIYHWVKKNWREFSLQYESKLKPKEYLKIFFVKTNRKDTQNLFKREGRRYLYPNLFNKNDYNKIIRKEVKGLPNPNMCMDESKKPYLDNKTRKQNIPCMINIETAYLWKEFFDYLEGQAARRKNNIYINLQDETIHAYADDEEKSHMLYEGIYLRVQQTDAELEIEYVTRVCEHRQKLSPPFTMKEVLNIPFEQYGNKHELQEVENLFDEIFFGRQLKYNYFNGEKGTAIKNDFVKKILFTYRNILWMIFRAGEFVYIESIINQMAFQIIMNSIQENHRSMARKQFNLWISTIDYVMRNRRLEEKMISVREEFKKHMLCKEEWKFSGPEEYYYAVGQLVGFFLQKSEAAKENKNMSFVNIIIKTKNNELIKEKLTTMFEKYNYKLTYDEVRFRKLYAHILEYPCQSQVDKKYIAYGFVDDNLVYVSQNEAEED